MYKSLLLITTLLFLSSCKEKNIIAKENIVIDTGKARSIFIEDVTDDLKYIPLNFPEDIYIGVISHIKSYDNYLFIHDEFQTKTITIVDKSGKFIAQLNKKGGGPGEYGSIDAYAFDVTSRQLIIYDRSRLNFMVYSFPELKYIQTIRNDKYIMNFEVLDANHFMVVSESDEGDNNKGGIEIWDKEYKAKYTSSNIGSDAASIEISYPNTITKLNDETYYAHPHEYTTIYKVDAKEQIPEFRIDFGKNKIPSEYWNTSDANKFEEAFLVGNQKAVWVHNFIFNTKKASFWLMYGDIETKYLIKYDRETKKESVISELKIKGSQVRLTGSVGVVDNKYISVIYPEELDDSHSFQDEKLSKAYLSNKEKKSPILVFYKL